MFYILETKLMMEWISQYVNYVVYLARSANLPTGLFWPAIPCVISFFFNDRSEPNYPRIYWTNFYDFFSPNDRYLFVIMHLDLFFRFLNGRCHGNQFWAKFAN